MSTYSLRLRGQRTTSRTPDPLPPLPRDVPEDLMEAGRYINYSLLLAETFGMDTTEALETVNGCFNLMIELDCEGAFDHEDAADLAPFLEEVTTRLKAAFGSQDQPTNMDGQRLLASGWIERDGYGALRSRARGHRLSEILENLYSLTRMFRFAAEHKLWLMME